jgi:hypothetical protein
MGAPAPGRPNPMERTCELCEFRPCMPAASSQRSKHEFILDLECSLQHVNPVLTKSAWMNYWCQGGAMQSLYPKAACLLIHGGRAQRPAGRGLRWHPWWAQTLWIIGLIKTCIYIHTIRAVSWPMWINGKDTYGPVACFCYYWLREDANEQCSAEWYQRQAAKQRGLSLGVVLCLWIRPACWRWQPRSPTFKREVKNSKKRPLHTECHGKGSRYIYIYIYIYCSILMHSFCWHRIDWECAFAFWELTFNNTLRWTDLRFLMMLLLNFSLDRDAGRNILTVS